MDQKVNIDSFKRFGKMPALFLIPKAPTKQIRKVDE